MSVDNVVKVAAAAAKHRDVLGTVRRLVQVNVLEAEQRLLAERRAVQGVIAWLGFASAHSGLHQVAAFDSDGDVEVQTEERLEHIMALQPYLRLVHILLDHPFLIIDMIQTENLLEYCALMQLFSSTNLESSTRLFSNAVLSICTKHRIDCHDAESLLDTELGSKLVDILEKVLLFELFTIDEHLIESLRQVLDRACFDGDAHLDNGIPDAFWPVLDILQRLRCVFLSTPLKAFFKPFYNILGTSSEEFIAFVFFERLLPKMIQHAMINSSYFTKVQQDSSRNNIDRIISLLPYPFSSNRSKTRKVEHVSLSKSLFDAVKVYTFPAHIPACRVSLCVKDLLAIYACFQRKFDALARISPSYLHADLRKCYFRDPLQIVDVPLIALRHPMIKQPQKDGIAFEDRVAQLLIECPAELLESTDQTSLHMFAASLRKALLNNPRTPVLQMAVVERLYSIAKQQSRSQQDVVLGRVLTILEEQQTQQRLELNKFQDLACDANLLDQKLHTVRQIKEYASARLFEFKYYVVLCSVEVHLQLAWETAATTRTLPDLIHELGAHISSQDPNRKLIENISTSLRRIYLAYERLIALHPETYVERENEVEELLQMLEDLILRRLYLNLIKAIDDVFASEMRAKTEQLHWLQPRHLGVDTMCLFDSANSEALETIEEACNGLDGPLYRTIPAKMARLSFIFEYVHDILAVGLNRRNLEVDTVLPALILIMNRVSFRSRLDSSLLFLQLFSMGNILSGAGMHNKNMFCTMQFMAAREFILNLGPGELDHVDVDSWDLLTRL